MFAKLAPALCAVFVATLLLSLSGSAASAATARELRAMVRCADAVAYEGLLYAHTVNRRLSSCLVPLRACGMLEDRNVQRCYAARRNCSGVPATIAAAGARLRQRIAMRCWGVPMADMVATLGFGPAMESCAPTSVEGFGNCLADQLLGTCVTTVSALHPGACELFEEVALGDDLPLDVCNVTSGSGDPPADTCEGPRYCGGPDDVQCPAGLVCDRTDPLCTQSDLGGVCVPAAEVCADEGSPVCGCDGTSYPSDCHRLQAGAVMRHGGSCEAPGAACGFGNPPCPTGHFCDYPEGDCGEGQFGTCRPMRDEPCNLCVEFVSAPVCGCDFVTYASECERQAAGASKWFDGSCF
jgi:hypothetical protein